jgi:tyrosyl-tRNA synthetase
MNSTDKLPWLWRGTSEIFPHQATSNKNEDNLECLISTCDRPLRIKLGIDPTGVDIHLGHSIPFRKLRAFQDAGHTAVVIIGDFTAQIGDPTGKSEVRRQLTPTEVRDNAQSYLEQLRPILDFDTSDRLEIRYNSEWLGKLDLNKTLQLLSTMTVGQMLAKEGFDNRFQQESPIYLHEFLYPLMQGYDSVAVDADVELGGTDQKFNIAIGRDLQKHFGKKPQFGLLLPILLGTDGTQKMSKSLGNYIGLKEDALSMYSKLQKISDVLLKDYFELLTDLSLEQLPANPRECQKLLALEVVSQYHGRESAQAAQKAAEKIVLQANTTAVGDAVPEYSLAEINFPIFLSNLLNTTGLCPSNSEGKRQIKGGAVRIDGTKIEDETISFATIADLQGKILQVGKKKFVRLVSP